MVSVNGELLERIRMEYQEMPDLCLTRWQATRLWNLEPTLCDDLLAALVVRAFSSRRGRGCSCAATTKGRAARSRRKLGGNFTQT
jgi:hypothetical protein